MCTHCKKTGYIVYKCYRIVGFPKDFKLTSGRTIAENANEANTEFNNENSHLNLMKKNTHNLMDNFNN